jgi:hypothetical protein
MYQIIALFAGAIANFPDSSAKTGRFPANPGDANGF